MLALLVSMLCSCVSQQSEKTEILLVTSFYPVYIFTKNIVNGIDDIRVECMAEQNTGCLHDYQLLSRDARLISDADAFIINGAGMETFLEDVYMSVENLTVIDSSENVELLEFCESHNEENHEEHHHEEHNHSVNSHIWMSPNNAVIQVSNIADALSSMYPQYENDITKNKDSYIKTLKALSAELAESAKGLKGKNIITFHESYDYLAKDYSFNVIATVESHDGNEPSAKGLAELTEIIKEHNVKVLFTEPDYKGSAATVLSNETGVAICVLNPVTKGDNSLTSYEDIMRENMNFILKAVG